MTKNVKNDIVVTVEEFNTIEGVAMDHIVTYQLKRRHLRALKKIMKNMFEGDNLF